MDKRIVIGLLVVGAAAAAYYFLVPRASAEELNYVRGLSIQQLQDIINAAAVGMPYGGLSAEQIHKLAIAAKEELQNRQTAQAQMQAQAQAQAQMQSTGAPKESFLKTAQRAAMDRYLASRVISMPGATIEFPGKK